MLEILGSRKDFGGRWVGSPTLNRLGLHPARIALSELCLRARRRQLKPLGTPDWLATLRREGVVVWPDFLASDFFEAVRAEVVAHMDELEQAVPLPRGTVRGFGPRRPFEGGFDRFDGGTLNRFAPITEITTPFAASAVRDPRLAALSSVAAGFRHRPGRYWLYQTVHGDEDRVPDLQKVLHRDTFHPTVKLWLFLDDVREEDGPFVYVPGSHRMSAARLRWEYQHALAASAPGARKGGAFRISEAEVAELGLPAPRSYPVRANTLVVADVHGFHRRGDARPGARRLALYASLRKWPFAPVAY
ncbi:phytanoyl-CoA dioxygenase family protein [Haliangium sp.]|uniref:phytanoyl-CoA dioxygenase family protein n=1 Tax=Haliangium sp. TaxID=2663208 RepID=UPI003D14B566